MQPIAAWLVLWDERVRSRMLTIAPEILIEHGDPSALPVDMRAQLLRQFASLNEGHIDTGASFDMASVRRLADPRLATTVLDLLHQHRENEDVRQLLLNIVWQDPIPVVYLHLTDNAAGGTCGTRVSLYPRDRGYQPGTAPVVFPPPPGRSRGALPPQAGLVACPSTSPAPAVPAATPPPTPTRPRASPLHGIRPPAVL
jgi:hypothetical protein